MSVAMRVKLPEGRTNVIDFLQKKKERLLCHQAVQQAQVLGSAIVNENQTVQSPRLDNELETALFPSSQTFLKLLEAQHLRGAAFRIALFIYEQTACAERTSCPLSERQIAKQTHYSKVTVSASLKKLTEAKIIWLEIPAENHYTSPRIIHLQGEVITACRIPSEAPRPISANKINLVHA